MRTQKMLKACLVLVLLVVAPNLGIAQAGRARDRGEYEILQARYGTARYNVDVTSRLRNLARQDSSFEIGNNTFGVDPDPNVVKTLQIYARDANGQDRMFEYKEGSRVSGSIFTGWSEGNFGRSNANNRWQEQITGAGNGNNPDVGRWEIVQARYGTARRNIDVTNRLRQLARRDQTFRMDNATFGVDPDQGTVKVLQIYAQDRNGRERMFEYTEGTTIDGALFTGWSNGQFGQSGANRRWQDNNVAADRSVRIVRATYGAGRQRRDVTARLQSLVQGGRLSTNVDNGVMGGDPAPNVPKELLVTFTDSRGRQQEVRVGEGEHLSLP